MMKKLKLKTLVLAILGTCMAGNAWADLTPDANGVYQIGSAQDLIDFAGIVNSGTTDANAVLTADIDMDGVTGWTPIGQDQKDYKGHFDGQGHRILKLTTSTGYNNQALFGQAVGGAIIENIIIDASCTIQGNNYTAGILGHVWGDGVIVRNCGNEADINGSGANSAGIVGCSEKTVYISNCYNIGKITGNKESAGICAWMGSESSTITNCYSTGEVIATGDNQSGSNRLLWRKDEVQGFNVYCLYDGQGIKITDIQLTNGYLCYQLKNNNETTWYQSIGKDSHPYPFSRGNNSAVYKYGENIYSNLNGDNIYVDGYFQLGNAADLALFAGMVNGGNLYANGKLTGNVDFRGQTIMIGAPTKAYHGTFDGQEKTITINYTIDTTGEDGECGLFRRINGATIKNLCVEGIITTRGKCAGGVISGIWQSSLVENCISYVEIKDEQSGDATHGGIVARVSDKKSDAGSITIRNCAFFGTINAPARTGSGGILGWPDNASDGQVKIENCLMAGTLSLATGQDNDVIVRNSATVTNCYYTNLQNMNNSKSATKKSTTNTGELCYLLNGSSTVNPVWHQTIGTDTYPVPFSTDHGFVTVAGNIYNNSSKTGDYFGVTNKADMEALATCVNAGNNSGVTVKLENDIDMTNSSFPGIGTSSNGFRGIFDGQKHRISNLHMSINEDGVGFFRYIASGGTVIKRFTIDSSCSFSGANGVGAFVGRAEGRYDSLDILLEELGNEANVTASGKNAGALLGVDMNSDGIFTVKNCYNTGTIVGTGGESGAFSGWFGDNLSIYNCYNIGTIDENQGSGLARANASTVNNILTCENTFVIQNNGGNNHVMVGTGYVKETTDFQNGTVFAALFDYTHENPAVDGSVWRMEFSGTPHPVLYDADIVLKENFPNRPVAQSESKTVKLYRQTVAGSWNTVCLPFALTTNQIKDVFGNEAKVAELTSDDNDVLHFTTTTSISAGKAYLVKPSDSNAADTYKELQVTISKAAPDGLDDVNAYGGFKFVGNFWPISLSTNGDDYVMAANNTIKKAPAGREMNAFRAYLHDTTTPASPSRATSFVIDDEGTSGIITAEGEVIVNGKVYNLNGQRINEPQPGINIKNGKKILVK